MTALVVPLVAGCIGAPAQEPLGSAAESGQLREFDLFVKAGVMEPRPGMQLFALGFVLDRERDEVTVPGPEIRVTEGDRVRVTLHGGHHTIHWHGLSVPWAMDGVPYMTQSLSPPGEAGSARNDTYVYEFVARETGTYWYHCHVDAPVHIDLGMFGAFIVEPRDRAADPAFDREATLFLHETEARANDLVDSTIALLGVHDPSGVHANPPPNPADLRAYLEQNLHNEVDFLEQEAIAPTTGQYVFSVGPRDHYPLPSTRYRPQYDTFMFNGKEFPHTEPVMIRTGETLRLRLVNAGQLVHTVHLHGHHGLVTHKDGYQLASPFYADTLGMFPGERYDVYVRGDNLGIWDLHDHGGGWGVGTYAATDGAFPGGMNTMLVYEDFPPAKLQGPEPPGGWTSGDYVVFAGSYKGVTPAARGPS